MLQTWFSNNKTFLESALLGVDSIYKYTYKRATVIEQATVHLSHIIPPSPKKSTSKSSDY